MKKTPAYTSLIFCRLPASESLVLGPVKKGSKSSSFLCAKTMAISKSKPFETYLSSEIACRYHFQDSNNNIYCTHKRPKTNTSSF